MGISAPTRSGGSQNEPAIGLLDEGRSGQRSNPPPPSSARTGEADDRRDRVFARAARDHRRLAASPESSGASSVPPMGRPVPGCSPVPVSFGDSRHEGRPSARTPCRPGPARAPDRPRSPSYFGLHWQRSRTPSRREVGRGWDASSADTRQGPPGVVRTPPAAAVRPLPGIRPKGSRRGCASDGQRRASFSRMSTVAETAARRPLVLQAE